MDAWKGSFTTMLNNTDPETQEISQNISNVQNLSHPAFFGYPSMQPPNHLMPMYGYPCFFPHASGYGMASNYSPGSSTAKNGGRSIPGDNISGNERQPETPMTPVSDSGVPPFLTQDSLENIVVSNDSAKRERWTVHEEKALAQAWVTISTDPSVGNAQQGGTFWKRITAYFNKFNKGKSNRRQDQIKSRFHRAFAEINEFNDIYNRINNQYLSGWSDDMKKQATREEWRSIKNNKPFTLEHMWEITKDYGKWNSAREEGNKSEMSPGSKRSSSNAEDQAETRPIGSKAAKARKRGKNKGRQHEDESLNDEYAKFNTYQQEKLAMLKEMREQLQSISMREELEILNTDTSEMTEDARAVHQQMCTIIRSKYNLS